MPDLTLLPKSAKRDAAHNESVHNQLVRRWVLLIFGIPQEFSRRDRYEFTAGFPQETGFSLGEPFEHFITFGLVAYKRAASPRKGRIPGRGGSTFCVSNL